MNVKNCMEEFVLERLDRVLQGQHKMCTCQQCRDDITALALNFLPPRYIVTRKGEVYSRSKTLEQQFDIDVIAAITNAAIIVGKTPHHVERE